MSRNEREGKYAGYYYRHRRGYMLIRARLIHGPVSTYLAYLAAFKLFNNSYYV